MARTGKLKVYRTAIGFHDAYVAAPSQKAALEAWGSDKDLFGRGIAELVTDETLTAEALAAPGTVIKRLRGTEAEQLAALPADTPKRGGADRPKPKTPTPSPKKPRPSRAKLDAAEAAIVDTEHKHEAALAEIARREKALAEEKRALRRKQDEEMTKLERARDIAAASHTKAMEAWRD